MAKKSFERQLVEWFDKTRNMVPGIAYDAYMTLLKKLYPDAFKEKKKGRPKAEGTSYDNFIIDGIGIPEAKDDDAIEQLLNLWGDSAKEWAKMALCLLECNIIPHKMVRNGNNKIKTFKYPIKTLHKIIVRNKNYSNWRDGICFLDEADENGNLIIEAVQPKIVGYDMFARALKEMQENEIDYSQEEREKDIKRVNKILPKIKKEIQNYIDQELAFWDGIDWYDEIHK